jgi:hypothetical protein
MRFTQNNDAENPAWKDAGFFPILTASQSLLYGLAGFLYGFVYLLYTFPSFLYEIRILLYENGHLLYKHQLFPNRRTSPP